MKRKKITAMLLTVATTMTMMACGNTAQDAASTQQSASAKESTTAAASSEAEGASTEEATEEERRTITFMSIDYYGTALANEGSEEVKKAAEDFTGVDVDFTWVANDSYSDKLGITLMDKANMPMVITFGSSLNSSLLQAAEDGAFWDLNDFIWDEEKYPYLSQLDKNVCKAFTVNGQLVGVYRARPIGRNGLSYRADWAEKLGLSEPKTIEDVYNMMYAFTYDDPDGNGIDDTYGLAMCKYTGPFDIMQTWFGVGNGWVEKDGKLVPVHQTEEYMEALNWFKKMYEDGLIYSDWATRDTNTWTDSVKNGECGMYVDVLDNGRSIWDYFENNSIPAVTGDGNASMKLIGGIAKEEGGDPHTLATSGHSGCFLITKAGAKTEEDVEACLRYLDRMNSQEMRRLMNYGLEGRDYEIDEEGYIVDLLSDMEASAKPQSGLNQTGPNLTSLNPNVKQNERQLTATAVIESNVKIAVHNPASGYLLGSSVYAESGSDLNDIISRARTQYIVGQLDEEGLKEQFKVWEQRGGNDLIEEINELYNADK